VVVSLLLARIAAVSPWTWLLAVIPALLLWLIVQKQRQLRAALAVLVTGAAEEIGLQAVGAAAAPPDRGYLNRGVGGVPSTGGHRLATPEPGASMDR
jgi:hypothetical protein